MSNTDQRVHHRLTLLLPLPYWSTGSWDKLCVSTIFFRACGKGINMPNQCHLQIFLSFLLVSPRDRGNENLSPIRNTNFTRRNHQMNPPFHFQILKMQSWIKGKMILSDMSHFCLFIHNKRTIQTRKSKHKPCSYYYFIAITITVILDAYNCIIIGSN